MAWLKKQNIFSFGIDAPPAYDFLGETSPSVHTQVVERTKKGVSLICYELWFNEAVKELIQHEKKMKEAITNHTSLLEVSHLTQNFSISTASQKVCFCLIWSPNPTHGTLTVLWTSPQPLCCTAVSHHPSPCDALHVEFPYFWKKNSQGILHVRFNLLFSKRSRSSHLSFNWMCCASE